MKSMTGYGMAKLEKNKRNYCIEIKSVNHRYIDISVKLPKEMSYLENEIKKRILDKMARGKIEVILSFENDSEKGKEIIINEDIAKKYQQQFSKLEGIVDLEMPIAEMLKLPEVVTIKSNEEAESEIAQEVDFCLQEALRNIIDMRKTEGKKIKEDLGRRIKQIKEKIEKISYFATGLLDEYVVKLKERIAQITSTEMIDEARITTEIVIYADKCSIEEEQTRLQSHINQLEQMIEQDKPIGKKIDFLLQEMNREINTIGSKSVKLEITDLVVEVKTILEDIREQIQNIE